MPLPPGPRQPSVAQLLQFTLRPLPFLDQCLARHGDPFTMRVAGLGTYVVVTAPELIKQVFTADPEALPAGEANAILEPVVGRNSVLLLDGKPHLRQRRLLLPPLHGERMQAYTQLMAEITDAALDEMPLGAPFSLHPHMQAITLKVILRAVFGLDESAERSGLERKLAEFLRPPPTITTFIPIKYLDFPLSPYRTFLARRDAVDVELRAIIRARREAADPARSDILSLLLAARDEEGQPMSDDELRDELMTMLLAGHETTATALSWAFACVLENPAAAARLDAELDGARSEGGRLDTALLPRLEFLDCVLKESLRLRPILPDVVRRVRAPITVGGYAIPLGVDLMPCIHLAHRRAESWPEPDRFLPQRFQGAKIDPYTWLPFGGGIRRCLGMAFALHEMKIVLGGMLARARFRLASPRPVRVVRRTITLAPSGGTRVVLISRRPRALRAVAGAS
ncbi:MAG: cytochrome P450 [Myxococcales bacterium]|nr:cytochrome P450 [Myxococcales bacterium]